MGEFVIPVGEKELPEKSIFVDIGSQDPDFVLESIHHEIEQNALLITKKENIGRLLMLIFQPGLREETRKKMMTLLYIGCIGLRKSIIDILNRNENIVDQDEIQEDASVVRNAIKMFIFLITRFILSENSIISSSQVSNSMSSKKKSTSEHYTKDWKNDSDKESILSAIAGILELDLNTLWGFDIDRTFLNLFLQLVFILLKNVESNKISSIRRCCVTIISLLVLKYERFDECLSQMMHSLRSNPAIVTVIAEFIENIESGENDASIFVGSLLKEMLNISSTEISSSEFPKVISSLIETISERAPHLMINYDAELFDFLANESHWIRNAIVKSICNIIIFVVEEQKEKNNQDLNLSEKNDGTSSVELVENGDEINENKIENENEDENKNKNDENEDDFEADIFNFHNVNKKDSKKNVKDSKSQRRNTNQSKSGKKVIHDEEFRKNLLDNSYQVLLNHVFDTNSFTRSQVLQIWCILCEDDCIPEGEIYNKVTALAYGRLRDKAAVVRKSAVRLLTELLINNPYHSNLSLKKWISIREKISTLLKKYNLLQNLDEHMDVGRTTSKVNNKQKNTSKKSLGKNIRRSKNKLEDDDDDDDDEHEADSVEDEDVENNSEGERIDELKCEEDEKEIRNSSNDSKYPENETNSFNDSHDSQMIKGLLDKYARVRLILEFVELISKSIKRITGLLNSKNNTDITESIKFLPQAKVFSTDNYEEGIKTVLMLVCSSEQALKDAAQQAYTEMYFNPSPKVPKSTYIATNLILLTQGATLGQLISLEELLKQIYKSYTPEITSVVEKLYSIFILGVNTNFRRGAVIIMWILFGIHPKLMVNWIVPLIKHGLSRECLKNPQLAKWTLLALGRQEKWMETPEYDDYKSKLPKVDQKFFQTVINIIDLKGPLAHKNDDPNFSNLMETAAWYPPAEQAINLIYSLAPSPGELMTRVIKQLYQEISPYFKVCEKFDLESKNYTSGGLSLKDKLERLIFIIGCVALKQSIFIEEVFSRRKVMLEKEDAERKKLKEKNKGKTDDEDTNAIDLNENNFNNEFHDDERKRIIFQESILSSKNLIGKFLPFIVSICSNKTIQVHDAQLHGVSVNALCKCILLTSKFCSENIEMICNLLSDQKTQPQIRQNITVALGDIAVRFPNEFDMHSYVLFDILSNDPEPLVRRNALVVLSHLILTFMTKPRGRLSDIAVCLQDEDEHVSHLAHLFFQELFKNNKDDYVKLLSETLGFLNSKAIDLEKYNKIVEYLLSFLENQRDLVPLVEKLALQFQNNTSMKNCRNLSFCISVLNHSEATLYKLKEMFKHYRHSLYDDFVKQNFLNLSRNKKFKDYSIAKILTEMFESGEDIIDDTTNEAMLENPDNPESKVKRRVRRINTKPTARNIKKKSVDDSSEDDSVQLKKRPRRSKKKAILESDSDVDEL